MGHPAPGPRQKHGDTLGMMNRSITFALFLLLASSCIAQADPYASLTPERRLVLQPAVDRFVRDVTKQDWKDLWEIQDQTSNMKNELLEGHRDAPDLARSQYVAACDRSSVSSS